MLGVVTRDRMTVSITTSDGPRRPTAVSSWSRQRLSPRPHAAREQLLERMHGLAIGPDTEFHQGDSDGAPVDFFTPLVLAHGLHPTFGILTSDKRYPPARELVAAMMRFHKDADGNFVEQLQTTGLDPCLRNLVSPKPRSPSKAAPTQKCVRNRQPEPRTSQRSLSPPMYTLRFSARL